MRGLASMSDVEAVEAVGVPRDLPESTYALIRRAAEAYPDAPALSFFLRAADHTRPETWTYRALFARITQTANLFHRLGARHDTVIAYVLPNLPETHFVLWGGQAAGIVLAINPLLEPHTITELLNAARASILVTLAPFPGTDVWPKMERVVSQVPSLQHVVLVDLADRVPGAKRVAAQLLQKREVVRLHGLGGVRSVVPKSVGVHDFGLAIALSPRTRLRSRRVITGEDVSSYFCTGGTTGLPKIAVRSHRNEVANAWSVAQILGDGFGPGKNVFCGLPLFHVNAVLVTGLLPFSVGAHVVLGTPQGYRGEGVIARFWEIVARHRIHFFSGVPTLYAALLEVPTDGHALQSLEFGLCGAAPMPVRIFREFQSRTGLKILEGYGLTEATCASTVNPPLGEQRIGSIGIRLPGQLLEVALLDDTGAFVRACADGEVGALLVSGPNVFRGYLSAEQNKRVFVERYDGRRWLDTGDLGRRDAEGYFWLTGRKKDLIIRGGHNIDPALIEEPLQRHPAVLLAAAVGRPDAHVGELPVAYVQLRPDARATEAELLEYLLPQIAERAALPKAIHVLATMPLTAVGKIFKPALKRLEIEDVLAHALREANTPATRLTVVEDAARGTSVLVTLADASDEANVEKVLGQYPFPFSTQVSV